MSGEVFSLYANCIPVKGARRSIMCDLQNGRFHFIPSVLYEILTVYPHKGIHEVKAKYDACHGEQIDKYFAFLLDHDLGFLTRESDAFPDLDLSWDTPSAITNAIIDFSSESEHPIERIVNELSALRCRALQLRFYDDLGVSKTLSVIRATANKGFRHVEIVAKYSAEFTEEVLISLSLENQVVSLISFHSAPANRQLKIEYLPAAIVYYQSSFDSPLCCGQVNPSYFSINIPTFTEARAHNSCLNQKIAIATDGSICNCPSLSARFGNINSTTLTDVAYLPEFRRIWSIAKDDVAVCKDCEFRYICTDCRAYTVDPSSALSKPLKCSYNPYSAAWKNDDQSLPVIAGAMPGTISHFE